MRTVSKGGADFAGQSSSRGDGGFNGNKGGGGFPDALDEDVPF